MRLLRTSGEELVLDIYNDESNLPEYAILSHVWLAAKEEVVFDDIGRGHDLTSKEGWAKLDYSRKEARKHDLEYVWIDTCCIDKSSSAELAEAINSMYRWYAKAKICYVYLADMPTPPRDGAPCLNDTRALTIGDSSVGDTEDPRTEIEQDMDAEPLDQVEAIPLQNLMADRSSPWNWDRFKSSKWFTRGWTLQELVAPVTVQFYSSEWSRIGTLAELAETVSLITGIHVEALRGEKPITAFSIAQRMSWAAKRETTKIEDQAYSLLGLFDVNMPVIYGEGEKAFLRLQDEILKTTSDQTIFAWYGNSKTHLRSRILAQSTRDFVQCGNFVPLEHEAHGSSGDVQVTPQYVTLSLPSRNLSAGWFLVALRCCLQQDRTKGVFLFLRQSYGGKDHDFDVGLNIEGQRILHKDILFFSQRFITRTFNILRRTHRSELDRRFIWKHRIVVRCEGRVKFIAQAFPADLWNSQTQTYHIPSEPDGMIRNRRFQGRLTIQYSNSIIPQRSDASLELPTREPEDSLCRTVVVTIDAESPYVDLVEFRNTSFEQPSEPGFLLVRYKPDVSMLVDLRNGIGIMTTLTTRSVLYENMIVAEIDTLCLWTVVVFDIFKLSLWILFALAILPGAVFLPVTALYGVRLHAYESQERYASNLISTYELNALEVGLPITFIVGIFIFLRDCAYIEWRPTIFLSLIPKKWSGPEYLVSRLKYNLWAGSARFLWSVPSAILAGLFLKVDLERDNANLEAAKGRCGVCNQLDSVRDAVIARLVCLLIFAFYYFVSSSWKRYRLGNLTYTLLNAATLIPIAWYAIGNRYVIVPWMKQACQERNVPNPAALLYSHLSNDTKLPFEHVCDVFANDARFLWPLLAIGFWTVVLDSVDLYLQYRPLVHLYLRPRTASEVELDKNIFQAFRDRIFSPDPHLQENVWKFKRDRRWKVS